MPLRFLVLLVFRPLDICTFLVSSITTRFCSALLCSVLVSPAEPVSVQCGSVSVQCGSVQMDVDAAGYYLTAMF